MHELGVVFHIIDDLKAVASDNDVSSISKVTIELGEVSGVVEEYLTDCWKWACKKEELVKDCEMEVEIIPGITYCCLLYTSPSPRDAHESRMPSSA